MKTSSPRVQVQTQGGLVSGGEGGEYKMFQVFIQNQYQQTNMAFVVLVSLDV